MSQTKNCNCCNPADTHMHATICLCLTELSGYLFLFWNYNELRWVPERKTFGITGPEFHRLNFLLAAQLTVLKQWRQHRLALAFITPHPGIQGIKSIVTSVPVVQWVCVHARSWTHAIYYHMYCQFCRCHVFS